MTETNGGNGVVSAAVVKSEAGDVMTVTRPRPG